MRAVLTEVGAGTVQKTWSQQEVNIWLSDGIVREGANLSICLVCYWKSDCLS